MFNKNKSTIEFLNIVFDWKPFPHSENDPLLLKMSDKHIFVTDWFCSHTILIEWSISQLDKKFLTKFTISTFTLISQKLVA